MYVPSGTPRMVARFSPAATIAMADAARSGGTIEVATTVVTAKNVPCVSADTIRPPSSAS